MTDTPDEVPVIHTITSNDTLDGLSDHFYGTPLLGYLIKEKTERDKNVTIDPRKLRPGDSLIIPGHSKDANKQYWRNQVRLMFRNRKVFHVSSQFQGTDEILFQSPVLIPPMPESVFGYKNVFTSGGLCHKLEGITQKMFENDDFIFEWKQDPEKAKKASDLDAKITIKANNVWKMGDTQRSDLRKSFIEFCSEIERLESGGIIIPGGAAILTLLVADALPSTFDEMLFFRYGFNHGFGPASTPYVDLHPGMRLRIEYSANQNIGVGSGLNGPVGSGQFLYTIGRDRDQNITFDNFLGSISAPSIPFASPHGSVSGSLIDLHAADNARRHFRLFYPSQMSSPDQISEFGASQNVTLIGAKSLEELGNATDTYVKTGDVDASGSILGFTLRGRSIIVPEIEVSVTRQIGRQTDLSSRYVPLGTTARQLMDSIVPNWHPDVLLSNRAVSLNRLSSLENGLPEYRQVQFHLVPGQDFDQNVIDLPLAMGDLLNVNLTAH